MEAELERLIILEEMEEEEDSASSISRLVQWLVEHQHLQEKVLDYLEGLSNDVPEISNLSRPEASTRRRPASISSLIRKWAEEGYTIDQMAESAALLGSAHPYELVRTVLRRLKSRSK